MRIYEDYIELTVEEYKQLVSGGWRLRFHPRPEAGKISSIKVLKETYTLSLVAAKDLYEGKITLGQYYSEGDARKAADMLDSEFGWLSLEASSPSRL